MTGPVPPGAPPNVPPPAAPIVIGAAPRYIEQACGTCGFRVTVEAKVDIWICRQCDMANLVSPKAAAAAAVCKA